MINNLNYLHYKMIDINFNKLKDGIHAGDLAKLPASYNYLTKGPLRRIKSLPDTHRNSTLT